MVPFDEVEAADARDDLPSDGEEVAAPTKAPIPTPRGTRGAARGRGREGVGWTPSLCLRPAPAATAPARGSTCPFCLESLIDDERRERKDRVDHGGEAQPSLCHGREVDVYSWSRGQPYADAPLLLSGVCVCVCGGGGTRRAISDVAG